MHARCRIVAIRCDRIGAFTEHDRIRAIELVATERTVWNRRRFAPDEDPVDGRLARRGERWYFDYDDSEEADDEAVYRLGDHRFAVGEYVTVNDEDGRPLTYKVVEIQTKG